MKIRFAFPISMIVLSVISCAIMPAFLNPSQEEEIVPNTDATDESILDQIDVLPPPRNIFYIGSDGNDKQQVYKYEIGRGESTQLTFETGWVEKEFDVSPTNGMIAYISDGQLNLTDSLGGNKQIISQGPARFPVWSSDGRILAFWKSGLYTYDPSTGDINLLLEDMGIQVPADEEYYPEAFSSDGNRLFVNVRYFEVGGSAIFDLNNRTLIKPSDKYMRGSVAWTKDGQFVYIANGEIDWFAGLSMPGFWRVNTITGEFVDIPKAPPTGMSNFAKGPTITPEENVLVFYTLLPELTTEEIIFQLVQFNPSTSLEMDDICPNRFANINEVVWSRDSKQVIVVEGSGADLMISVLNVEGCTTELLPFFAKTVRWGY